MVEFECPDCGYLFDTPNHEFGCLPYHDTRDPNCRARQNWETPEPLIKCATCSAWEPRTV